MCQLDMHTFDSFTNVQRKKQNFHQNFKESSNYERMKILRLAVYQWNTIFTLAEFKHLVRGV